MSTFVHEKMKDIILNLEVVGSVWVEAQSCLCCRNCNNLGLLCATSIFIVMQYIEKHEIFQTCYPLMTTNYVLLLEKTLSWRSMQMLRILTITSPRKGALSFPKW